VFFDCALRHSRNHVLNAVDIPPGIKIKQIANKCFAEVTSWIMTFDLTNRIVYYRDFVDQGALRAVDLKRLDFGSQAPYKALFVNSQCMTITDVTDQLKP